MAEFRSVFASLIAVGLASAPALAGMPAAAQLQLASPTGVARATISPQAAGAAVVVERHDEQGWHPAWTGLLRNGSAGNVELADDGRMLGFDDGASDGKDAIELFDAHGRRVRDLDLGDFLPQAYVQALPRDGARLLWRRASSMSAGQELVEFSVPVPGEASGVLRFSIDLRDGIVRTSQLREYLAAAQEARAIAARTAQGDQAAEPLAAGAAVGPLASK